VPMGHETQAASSVQHTAMRRAYTYTILAVLAWTTGPVGSKAALLSVGRGPRLTPLQVAFWAIGIGWVALLALLIVRGRLSLLRAVAARGWVVLAGMGLCGWSGYPALINYAYTKLPLPDALIISYLNPVLVTLFQGPAFGSVVEAVSRWQQQPDRLARRSTARVAAALSVCLLGVATTATGGRLLTLAGMRFGEGAAAALCAAIAWAVYSNLGRFVPVKEGYSARGLGDVQNFAAMTVGLAVMGGLLVASNGLALPVGYHTRLHLGAMGVVEVSTWLVIALVGVVNYAVGYPLWLHALEVGSHAGAASRLPPLTYLLLVTSVALGWSLLLEPFGPGFWQGAGLIALGNMVNLWPQRACHAEPFASAQGELRDASHR